MSEYFETTVNGQLLDNGRPIACPHCGGTRNLTIHGHPGQTGRLRHCGRNFNFPRGWDARQALINASFDRRRVRT